MMRKPGHCRGCHDPVPVGDIRRAKIALLANGLTVDTVDRLMPRCSECVETEIRRVISQGEGDE